MIFFFFFRKFNSSDSNIYNFNKSIEFNTLNNSKANKVLPTYRPLKVTQQLIFDRKTRYPRHVQNMYIDNDKQETSGRRIKIIMNLQPENEKDMYDNYEDGKYYDGYREKNIKGLTDDWKLKNEIERNSKPITRTLSESQERKRCSKNIFPELGVVQSQKSQKIFTESNESERKIALECEDCNILKSNKNPEKTDDSDLQLKRIDDEDFINILKQLIDKLEKPKHSKPVHSEIFKIRKSDEPDPLEHKAVEKKVANSSSEEELILKIEKIKGNRVLEKLDSSLENTFVNGKWIRNNLAKSKSIDCKSEVNDVEKVSNDKNESISKNDTKLLNLKDTHDRVLESVAESLPDTSQNVGKQENKGISTSPVPEEKEHFLVSRETVKPLQYSTTLEDDLRSTGTDENNNLHRTTDDFKERFTEKDHFSNNNEGDDMNLGKSLEPTTNNFQTTAVYESTEESTSDLNNTSKLKSSDETLETNNHRNEDHPEKNHSEAVPVVGDSGSDEKENTSLEDNDDCSCDKKVIKNILSSTTMQNITEIKTAPNGSKSRSSKRLNNYQRKNDQNKNSKNATNDATITRNENILPTSFLNKNHIKQVKPSINNHEKSNVNLMENSMLITDNSQPRYIKDNRENKIMKTFVKNSSPKYMIPNLKTKQFKSTAQKRNEKENVEKFNRIKNKPMPLIPRNPPQNSGRFAATKLNQQITDTNDHLYGKYDDKDIERIATNKRIFTTPKNLAQLLTKTIDRSPSRRKKPDEPIGFPENGETIDTKSRSKIHKKSNLGFPLYRDLYSARHFGERINADGLTETKKTSSASKKSLRTPVEIIHGPSYQDVLRRPGKLADDLGYGYGTKESSRKSVTRTREYGPFNPNTRDGKASREYIDNEQIQNDRKYIEDNNDTNHVRLRKLPNPSEYHTSTSDGKNSNNIATDKIHSDSKSTQSIEISKTPTVYGTPTIFNDDISSTPKPKKSLIDEKSNFNLVPSFSSTPSSKNKNSVKNRFSTESSFVGKTNPNSYSKAKDRPDLGSRIRNAQRTKEEHAPYTVKDLEPIEFNEPTGTPERPSAANSESVSRSSLGSQSSSEHGFKSSRPLSTVRPEHQRYRDAFNENDDDGDVPDFDENRGENSGNTSANRRRFGVLSGVRATNDDGVVFGRQKPVDDSGSVDGKSSVTGDFRLMNEHEHFDRSGLTPAAGSSKGSDAIRTPSIQRHHVFNALRANNPDDDNLITPVQFIQVFSNSDPCPNEHDVRKSARKSECNNGGNFREFRNGSRMMSSARSRENGPDLGHLKKKYEKAYDHFDSEILDRFLRVYNPHMLR